ncbi:MAG: dihydropteroate synthase [Chthoniobacterales bacterium]
MGILNINDDSFSGDGRLDQAWAFRRALEMLGEGADIIDVGAESARTNRPPISEEEEIARLEPFLKAWPEILKAAEKNPTKCQRQKPLLSVNTWRPEVADAALEINGDILNDMSGLSDDANAKICAKYDAALLIMHTVGLPKQSHTHIRYTNVVSEVESYLKEKMALALKTGLPKENIILDVGLGFAKQSEDDFALIASLERFSALGRPILVPISRKGFIREYLGSEDNESLDVGSVAAMLSAARRGADILRVHNVSAAYQGLSTMKEVR